MHLKFRRPGDRERRSVQELKEQLEAGEKRARAARSNEGNEIEEETKRRKVLTDAQSLDADVELHKNDKDSDEEENEDEEDDYEEDDEEELMRELEKIKQERAAERERQEASEQTQNKLTREEEIARGNPLLNLEKAVRGDVPPRPADTAPKRWDDDLIFRNQAAGADPHALSKRGFVNDLIRTEFHKKFMSVSIVWLTSAISSRACKLRHVIVEW